ncbi:MAG: hypothetical protein ACI8WW_002275, partial [Oceanospirillaceae bacterium]
VCLVLLIYATINVFYYFKLIPPVPLALQHGIAAHHVQVVKNKYLVTYETDEWYIFWREHQLQLSHKPGENVYAFTSIFAPTDIKKEIFHRWRWYNGKSKKWETADNIGFDISGGRDDGYRGYTYKNNVKPGLWQVKVTTEEGLVLGVIDFEIIRGNEPAKELVIREF